MNIAEFKDSVFTSDVIISKPNVPIFVLICCLAMGGAMLFGIFFGRQEAQSVHLKERGEVIKSFTAVMAEKDLQIQTLTGVISKTQKIQSQQLAEINSATQGVAEFLHAYAKRSNMPPEDFERLEAHIGTLKSKVEPGGAK